MDTAYHCYPECGSVALWFIKHVACCSRHLLRAMNHVTGRNRSTVVKVRQVNRQR